MELKITGKIIKGIGGAYRVRVGKDDAQTLIDQGVKLTDGCMICRARGVFRHEKHTLAVGDDVILRVDTELASVSESELPTKRQTDGAVGGVMIEEVLPRRNDLIRPPIANIDIIFAVFAAKSPEPALSSVDKLITIAEYKHIEPVVIITKADLAPDDAERYAEIYRQCGFFVFVEGKDRDGASLEAFIRENSGKVSVFAGASGVGKSTLMNRLFTSLGLATGEVSVKTQRGKHTTRHVELYPLEFQFGSDATGYIADTPGFGMLDFIQFDFYTKDDLPYVFREFEPYIGSCRYTKCTHTKEEGCAILEAIREGKIPAERQKSYYEFYEVLKNKHAWDKK